MEARSVQHRNGTGQHPEDTEFEHKMRWWTVTMLIGLAVWIAFFWGACRLLAR